MRTHPQYIKSDESRYESQCLPLHLEHVSVLIRENRILVHEHLVRIQNNSYKLSGHHVMYR